MNKKRPLYCIDRFKLQTNENDEVMNIKDLNILRQLVKTNSLTQASYDQKIHKSNLSKKISVMEQEIGCKLFKRDRGKEGLEPTEKGKYFFEKIEHIINQYEDIKNKIKSYPELPENITIYTTNLIIEDAIVSIMSDMIEKFNDLQIDFMARNALISAQEKERVFTISPKTKESEYFHQVDLQDFHIKLWASKTYLKNRGCPKKLEDLQHHQILVFAKHFDDKTYPSLNWFMDDKFSIPKRNIICLNSSPALIKAASLGLGIISLAEESVYAHGIELVPILEQYPGEKITTCFSFPRYLEHNQRLQELAKFFRVKFQHYYKIST